MRRLLLAAALAALLLAPLAHAWTWPSDGAVLQAFSFDPSHPYAAGQHRGIDIAGSAGETVVAPAGGTVSFAGSVPSSGKTVSIETGDGYTATLTHLGSTSVSKGASVNEGDAVGTIGSSGYVQLGIRTTSNDQGYLDPLSFLPARVPAPPALVPAPAPDPTSAAPAEPAEPAPAPAPAPAADAPAADPPAADEPPAADVPPADGPAPVADAPAADPSAADPSPADAPAADPPAVALPSAVDAAPAPDPAPAVPAPAPASDPAPAAGTPAAPAAPVAPAAPAPAPAVVAPPVAAGAAPVQPEPEPDPDPAPVVPAEPAAPAPAPVPVPVVPAAMPAPVTVLATAAAAAPAVTKPRVATPAAPVIVPHDAVRAVRPPVVRHRPRPQPAAPPAQRTRPHPQPRSGPVPHRLHDLPLAGLALQAARPRRHPRHRSLLPFVLLAASAPLLLAARVLRKPVPTMDDRALLRDHTDLLRERPPAHRSRLHDDCGGHPRAPSPAAWRGDVLPHRRRRARDQGLARR